MSTPSANVSKPHVAILTPPGRGAVATLRLTGPGILAAVDLGFRPATPGRTLGDFDCGRIVFGRWGDDPGEDIVACRTSDEEIELHCHGGRVAADRIAQDLTTARCELLGPEQWLDRHECVLRREALLALSQARTTRTAAILLDQYQGAWQREYKSIRDLAANADFDTLLSRLETLLAWADLGMHLIQPWRVVLAGQPNVGKSSLINAIVGYQRAIVFNQPGTTRDVVTAESAIDGWPILLADTAGLHETIDDLEAAGIERCRNTIAAADCLVLVLDASRPWSPQDERLVCDYPHAVVVHNKADLKVGSPRPAGLYTCATTNVGLEPLLKALSATLAPAVPPPRSAVPFTSRQVESLRRAADAIRMGDRTAALGAIARLNGE